MKTSSGSLTGLPPPPRSRQRRHHVSLDTSSSDGESSPPSGPRDRNGISDRDGLYWIERSIIRFASIDPEMPDYEERFRSWWAEWIPQINCDGGIDHSGFDGGPVVRLLAYHDHINAIEDLINKYEMPAESWLFTSEDRMNLAEWADLRLREGAYIGTAKEHVNDNILYTRLLIEDYYDLPPLDIDSIPRPERQ